MTTPTLSYVDRYDCESGCPLDCDSSDCCMMLNAEGDYVRWEDYERLLRELEALKANESA